MATPPPVSTIRSTDPSLQNDEIQTDDNVSTPSSLLQSAERLIAPIQTPLPAGTPVQQQPTGGFTSTFNSANPTFAVLKATALQQALGHPMAYARALMQMGYEPLPAARGKTLFGKEAIFYPNVFRYLKYIYNIDGFTGLYRGFGCSLLSKMVCWYTTTKVDQLLGPVEPVVPNDQTKVTWDKCIKKTVREVRCQSWGILISHPFQVMAIRCMGQFIGREKAYSSINIFQNFQEIYDRQGIGGFFVGLIPRWLLEIATIVISNVLIHMLKTQLPSQTEMVPMYEYMAAFVAQTVTYPLSVVTTVTAINRSGLRAGMVPITPIYANWQDAYNKLGRSEQLKRGSGFFNRAAFGTVGIPTPGTPIPNA
ncbi:unnamed protein product [Adineta steineri]|uniref:Uncharacterized protein n=2 Tax=Adineta steineri TaxID=433720 RepID=A0A815IPF9_9BILA|nr:unnamed protein product [Adineta steineri]CAF1215947.1 unnamed protein product [Adineta steineri]CAF1363731.1 unnamed protein product [Adineta steineri]CAF1368614.1 unnamed protein product [Adineta steineri]CAF1538396.1 unnamed protein product [Adineta steineri]